jgi:MFS family permease
MLSIFVSIAALILGYFFTMLGHGLLSTLLGVRAVAEGFPTEVIGGIMSAYYAGFVIGTQVADKLIGRVGHIRAFAVFAATTSIAAAAHAILIDPYAWGAFRLVGGFGMAGLSMVTESWLNERATNENRGRVLSTYMLTVFIGIGAGQFLLVLDSTDGFMLFSVAAILFCLALIPVSLTRVSSPAPIESSRFTLAKMWRLSPLALVGMFAGGMITGAFSGMGAVFAAEVGLDTAGIARMMAIAVLGGLLLQWPLGRLSDMWDRRWVLTVIGLGTALSSIGLVATASGSGLVFDIFALAFGGFSYTMYSVAAAHANDFIEPEDLVQAAGGLLFAFGLGAAFGPFAASLVMTAIGPAGLFVHTALAASACTVFALVRMRARPTPPSEERDAFVAQPQGAPVTTPMAYQLDPRAEYVEAEAEEEDPTMSWDDTNGAA